MSDKEFEFLKKLQNTLLTAGGSLIVIILVAIVPFYFNTNSEIAYIKKEQEKKADKATYEITVREIQKDISEINSKLDKKADK